MNDKVWIHSNRFKDDMKEVQYFNIKEPKNIYKKTIDAADFTLNNLITGNWCIRYTTKQYFTMNREPANEYLKELRNILSLTDKQYDLPFSYLNNLMLDNINEEPLTLLYDRGRKYWIR